MDLPEDPNLKDFTGSKPAFASKSNTPRKSDSPRTSTGSRVGHACWKLSVSHIEVISVQLWTPKLAAGTRRGAQLLPACTLT